MKKKALFFLLVFLISVSCRKDLVPVTVDGVKSIVCQVSVMGANDDTKSSVVTYDLLNRQHNTFRMDAWLEANNRDKRRDMWPQLDDNPHYIKDAIMISSGNKWSPSADSLFWTNQIQTNFWAQYPDTTVGRGDLIWTGTDDKLQRTPSFHYDMSAYLNTVDTSCGRAAKVTPDLLVAYSRAMWDEDNKTGGVLNFNFAHVLSAIKFNGGGTVEPYHIDSVKITGVCTKGQCQLSGDTLSMKVSAEWEADATSIGGGFSQVLDVPYYDGSDYIFLIPQKLTSISKVTAYVSKGEDFLCSKEVSIEGWTWKPGCQYFYTPHYDPERNSFIVTVNEEGYQVKTGVWDKE